MGLLVKDIFLIDPTSIAFTDGTDDGGDIYPSKAFQINVVLDGQFIETYGVVWENENETIGCFISEEFEEHLLERYPNQFTDECAQKMTDLIADKHNFRAVSLPMMIWE